MVSFLRESPSDRYELMVSVDSGALANLAHALGAEAIYRVVLKRNCLVIEHGRVVILLHARTPEDVVRELCAIGGLRP